MYMNYSKWNDNSNYIYSPSIFDPDFIAIQFHYFKY